MNFETIDTTHKDIVSYGPQGPTVNLQQGGFYFNNSAVKTFEMIGKNKKPRYINFLRGKNENGSYNGYWYIVVNETGRGFLMSIDKRKENPGIRIFNRALFVLFTRSTKTKKGDSFYLQKTGSEQEGNPIIEILLNKSIQELKKQAHD